MYSGLLGIFSFIVILILISFSVVFGSIVSEKNEALKLRYQISRQVQTDQGIGICNGVFAGKIRVLIDNDEVLFSPESLTLIPRKK